ncbi:hypothetical protein ACFS07_11970 [Undibacterium arcticum]
MLSAMEGLEIATPAFFHPMWCR